MGVALVRAPSGGGRAIATDLSGGGGQYRVDVPTTDSNASFGSEDSVQQPTTNSSAPRALRVRPASSLTP